MLVVPISIKAASEKRYSSLVGGSRSKESNHQSEFKSERSITSIRSDHSEQNRKKMIF